MTRSPRHSADVGAAVEILDGLEGHVERELGLLAPGTLVAFAIAGEIDQLVLAVELSPALRRQIKPDALAEAIWELAAELALAPLIVFVGPGQLPAAADARARRAACASLLSEGGWPDARAYREGLPESQPEAAPEVALAASSGTEQALSGLWAEVLKLQGAPAPDASFFGLGGTSLAAAQLLLRIQERFGVSPSLERLLDAPTLRALAVELDRAIAAGEHTRETPITPVSRRERLPLSAAQRRMYFLWQLDPDSAAYNICGALALRGVLDVGALQRALDALVARHEALRTRFPEHAGEPYQQIDAPTPVWLRRDDLRQAAPTAREHAARVLRATESQRGFDLGRGPLFRVRLIQLRESEQQLIVTLHHSIADGASMNVLLADLTALYIAASAGRAPQLPALPVQYADYAAWQDQRLASGEAQRQLAYHRAQLGEAQPPLALPSDRPRPATQSFRGARHRFVIAEPLAQQLKALARAHDASSFMLLLAAFELLLSRSAQVEQVHLGLVAENRLRAEAAGLVGPLVNTQVIALAVHERESFAALLGRVKAAVLSGLAHQELPFEQLVEVLQPARDPAYNPLFQVMYNHQQRDLRAVADWPGLDVETLEVGSSATRFDLSLNTEEDHTGKLTAAFVYATDLFDAERIEQLAARFQRLLGVLIEPGAVSQPLAVLPWLEPAERAQLAHWSAPEGPLGEGFVHAWITERAAATPDAIACVFGDESQRYVDLIEDSTALAQRLAAAGAGPDVVVGVLLPRSLALPAAVLGILQSGAAYLPLDPELPAERIAYMRRDAGARLVVTTRKLAAELQLTDADVIALDGVDALGASVQMTTPPVLHPDNLAYVLYTSGSTGQPKAVGNTHRALAERLAWMQREYALSQGEAVLHKTPLTFDVAVWELLLPLMASAKIVLAEPGDHRDPQRIARLITEHSVTTVHFVPSLLSELVAQPEAAQCRSLRRLFSGGEALTPDLQARVHEALPWVRLDNRYGPTEALINASYWTCQPGSGSGPVPIGRPIPNTSLRVLDGSLGELPVGVSAELHIGGAGLARGYLGRPSLTAERFVPDPYAKEPGARLYRSGDWARWRADGVVEYLGRRDHQVKIRGVRVELGELEAALAASPGVEAAAAIAVAGPAGDARLVGYVVAQPELDLVQLSAALAERLPSALVPAQLVRLPSLPRLSSGKLDRAALPAPVWQTREYIAPTSEVERS
ncbi:MAG: amino acid adenylation domain-containing protein, partial [Polyangiales bacterium]